MSIDAANGSGDASQIARAQGIVSAQTHCTLDAALVLVQDTARTTDETLENIAALVVNRSLSFA